MIDRIGAEDFENLPDNSLAQRRDSGSVMLEVIEVVRLSAALRSVASFALILRENGARLWESQGIYVYDHPQHGELELFTVPIGSDAHGMRYEINFN
ncbi:hypothetical protein ELE36_16970 [Pseudolysobacter antarcticus]|uniref:DUF6916 domain-containing protein n=1 Tax=Pseudolysobacter antarcticus TaxID=2511995 RepID=A0A411HN67_9GAMM|nr:hypothetical protein [Pseudolysobacter antarcticus]QBB71914.1 hypothetical protein ELE36_16970 [Pseudolysobacter antarcticus]